MLAVRTKSQAIRCWQRQIALLRGPFKGPFLVYDFSIAPSYIVHPMNHFADFITIPLTELGKISDDNVQRLLDQSPDVIICNTSMIINGIEERIDGEYICELESFGINYFQLNTDEFRENSNLFYFKDPVRVLNVFIKK